MSEATNSTHTRGELPTRPTYCTQCQANGHACLAPVGFNLCAFCEDGVACPFLRAAAERNVAAAKNAPWLAPKKSKAADEGVRATPPVSAPKKNKQEGEAMPGIEARHCTGCTKKLHGLTRGTLCPACRVPESSSPAEARTCAHEGCAKKLRSDNTTGLCTEHGHNAKRVNGKGNAGGRLAKPKQPKAAARANGNGAAKDVPRGTNGGATAMVCVPVAALDNWWNRRTVDEKAAAFGLWLEDGGDAISEATT